MHDKPDNPEHENGFPWEDVDASRRKARLQRKHSVADAQQRYLESAKACPKCSAPPGELAWFYFESPRWTWDCLCGRAGWMTVCDSCQVQVDFFLEILN
jgi:hypothetical protein